MIDLNGTSFELDHFDYYLSNVKIIHDGGQTLVLPEEVYLIEPDNHIIYLGYMNVVDIEAIEFGIGVPENINTFNGADAIDISAYPPSHPLSYQDPAMHWGWSAGYMQMIVGGYADSDDDDIVDEYFEIHSVGKDNYANVSLPVIENNSYEDQIDITLNCNLDIWLTGADIKTVGIMHGTTGVNATVMENVEILPVFNQSANASSSNINLLPGKAWFFNHPESMEIYWEGIKDLSSFVLIDVQGKIVDSGLISGIKGSRKMIVNQGAYQLRLLNADGLELKKFNVVR
jgi:hypothetical protein